MEFLIKAHELIGWSGWWRGDLDAADAAWSEMRRIAHDLGWRSREAEAIARLMGVATQQGDQARRRHPHRRGAWARGNRIQSPDAGTDRQGIWSLSGNNREGRRGHRGAPVRRPRSSMSSATTTRHTAPTSGPAGRSGFAAGCLRRLAISSVPKRSSSSTSGTYPRSSVTSRRRCSTWATSWRAAAHAEDAVRLAVKDDWATVASTGMVLGLVREAQGRLDEAEPLLREAVEVHGRTSFRAQEVELSLAEFLLRRGPDGRRQRVAWPRRARASM